MNKQNLNNNTLYITASVHDSITVAYHKLCNPDFTCFNLGCAHRQTALIPSESWTLELSRDFKGVLGGLFF